MSFDFLPQHPWVTEVRLVFSSYLGFGELLTDVALVTITVVSTLMSLLCEFGLSLHRRQRVSSAHCSSSLDRNINDCCSNLW